MTRSALFRLIAATLFCLGFVALAGCANSASSSGTSDPVSAAAKTGSLATYEHACAQFEARPDLSDPNNLHIIDSCAINLVANNVNNCRLRALNAANIQSATDPRATEASELFYWSFYLHSSGYQSRLDQQDLSRAQQDAIDAQTAKVGDKFRSDLGTAISGTVGSYADQCGSYKPTEDPSSVIYSFTIPSYQPDGLVLRLPDQPILTGEAALAFARQHLADKLVLDSSGQPATNSLPPLLMWLSRNCVAATCTGTA